MPCIAGCVQLVMLVVVVAVRIRDSVVNWQRAGMANVDGQNRQAKAKELKEGEALGVRVLTEVEVDGGDAGSTRER